MNTGEVQPEPHPVASSDGVTVVAWDHGGTGPPVVFCHATGFHGRYWDPACRRLAAHFRCIAIDLRGHGDSVLPVGASVEWHGMADDVLAVVDALALGPGLRAVGHSMGGASIVIAELARPGTFARAWLCEPIIVPPEGWPVERPEGPNALAEAARRRREVFASREEAYERYAARPPFAACDPEALRAYVQHGFRDLPDGTVILKCRGAVEAAVFEQSRHDAFERLGVVQTEVVVAASGDGQPPALAASLVAGALPNGRLEELPELTHFAPMEDPGRVAASILAALG
jgi:pimeloyl-ACP methyl ester carboxylesterase